MKAIKILLLATPLIALGCGRAEYTFVKRPGDHPQTNPPLSPFQTTPTINFKVDGPKTTELDTSAPYTQSGCPDPDQVKWQIEGIDQSRTGPKIDFVFKKEGSYVIHATCGDQTTTATIDVVAKGCMNDPASCTITTPGQNK